METEIERLNKMRERIIEKAEKINFVHMDVDTYETTKFVLKNEYRPQKR